MLKQIGDVLRNVQGVADKDDRLLPDGREKPIVRVLNGALDEDPNSPNSIVLNGRLDPATLRFLKVDQSYQRPLSERPEIFTALKDGVVVPNIDIGVRGQDFTTQGDNFVITSPAYIIDGWQRVGNALRLLELIPDHPIRIFATIHFGTDDVWERHRFTELNKNVKKVSPNLHLRNLRDQNEAVLTLYGLSNNTREFVLYGKVSWSQNMKRGELITALQLVKTARRLHAHLTTLSGSTVEGIAQGLAVGARKAKLDQFRKNVTLFYEVVEECFGLRSIEFSSIAPQVKSPFMIQLARMFSAHLDFWDTSERVFFVSADARHKLAKFPIRDPHIAGLCGTAGAAQNLLYDHLIRHMDSGKRTGHLRSRYADDK